jgi:phosphatidate cytidylyltransferase
LFRCTRAEAVSPNTLKLRILSALVMAPVAVAAVWFGWPWLPLVTAVAGAAMAWEWARLCGGGRIGNSGAVLIGSVLAAIAAAAAAGVLAGLAIGIGGALVV